MQTLQKSHQMFIILVALHPNFSSDGRVVRASASGDVHLGLIPSRVKPMTLKLLFTAFLLDAQHYRDSVENKAAISLVVALGKALSGIPPSLCGRQMDGRQLQRELV